jgi:hypothetical protein
LYSNSHLSPYDYDYQPSSFSHSGKFTVAVISSIRFP